MRAAAVRRRTAMGQRGPRRTHRPGRGVSSPAPAVVRRGQPPPPRRTPLASGPSSASPRTPSPFSCAIACISPAAVVRAEIEIRAIFGPPDVIHGLDTRERPHGGKAAIAAARDRRLAQPCARDVAGDLGRRCLGQRDQTSGRSVIQVRASNHGNVRVAAATDPPQPGQRRTGQDVVERGHGWH